MNREELIEEAADAMFTANDGQPDQGYDDMARAALAVFGEAWSHERTVNIPRAEWERLKRFEQAHTAHAKPVGTSPEPVKTGADSSHVTPADDERGCGCTTRQVRYVDGEWSRELELVPCEAHCRTPTDDEVRVEAERLWPLDCEYSPRQTRARFSVEELDAYCASAFKRGARWAAGFRRTVQGEPTASCPKCGTTVTDQTPSTFYTRHDETCGGALEEPQGEPSDAAIIAGLRAFFDYENKKPVPNSWALSYWGPSVEQMRRALRAAAATQEGENRG